MNALRTIVLTTMLALGATAGATDRPEFDNAEQLARYKALLSELRCLQCQNQNILDSDAPLAHDLRREVYRLILEGKSDQGVLDFLVARYGDFILYRPPWKSKTVLLWTGPFLLGVVGVGILLMQVRRRRAEYAAATPLSDEERARLQSLLDSQQPP
ncbi:MAG: cytochrome c-type biogenesis protein CcmH [Gammaproteobacteria bacterium]|nr:MAG: cytochrome c-type biogenesis protein CcmH [Gammaproteobacteria bacterium]